MIHFIIKFLICFTKPKPPPKKGLKKKSPKSPSTSGKKSCTRYSKPPKNSDPDGGNIAEDSEKNIIQCPENVREWCHIEYCLFNDVLPIVEITVVTWGGAAKIYTEDDWRAVETVVIDDCVWVHFSMVHKIAKLNDEQVDLMKENLITFKFSQDPTKMTAKIAKDWPQTFLVCNCKDSVETKWFRKLRQSEPPDDSHYSAKARLENYKMKNEKSTDQVFMASMLDLLPCDQIIESKVKEVMETMSTTPSAEIYPVSNVKKINKRVRKKSDREMSGKPNKKHPDPILQEKSKLFLKSSSLVAGKTNVCVESVGISPGVRYAATFTSASKMLTEEQNFSFVPLSITIEEVENMPKYCLDDLHVDSVYARYELAPLFEARTSDVSVRKGEGEDCCRAEFNDTRLWFVSDPRERARRERLTQRPGVIALIESLQTRRLVVTLFGARPPEERPVEPCIFGTRPDDLFISTPGHPMFAQFEPRQESKDVLLGSACFNLVRLAKGHTTLEESAPLGAAPASSWSLACDDWNELAEERAELAWALSARGAIPDHQLIRRFTSIKIRVALGCPLGNVPEKDLILIPNVFHRLIIVFKNYSYACAVVERITSTNQAVAEPSASASVTSAGVSNLALRYACEGGGVSGGGGGGGSLGGRRTLASIRRGFGLTSSVVQQIKEFRRMLSCSPRAITGFFVKHADESLLVLESIPYVSAHATEPLRGAPAGFGRVVCDTSVFFGRRLYGDFERSVLVVEPDVSLDALLAGNQNESRSRPGGDALLLLDRLRRARTVNEAAVEQLFPSADQLLAFQAEYASGRHSPGESSCPARGDSSGSVSI